MEGASANHNRFEALSPDPDVTFKAEEEPSLEEIIKGAISNLPERKGRDKALLADIATVVMSAISPVVSNLLKKDQQQKQGTTTKWMSKVDERLDEMEQYSRRDNVIVRGLKEDGSENTTEKVCELAKEIGVKIEPKDVSTSHRVGMKKEDKPRPIVVKFVRRDTKTQMLIKKRALKSKEHRKDVYIDEHLSPLRSKMIKAMRKDETLEYVWCREGKLMCKKKGSDKKVIITKVDELFSKLEWSEEKMKDSGLFLKAD